MTKIVIIFKQSAVISKNVYVQCRVLFLLYFILLSRSDHHGLLGNWFYEYGVLQRSSVDCDNDIQIA